MVSPDRTVALLTDTVGFIRKLPHHLVASFHSTLVEAIEADLLLHVVPIIAAWATLGWTTTGSKRRFSGSASR